MARVLILSVGGSQEPVINACREYKPDFIYFFCSGGKQASSVVVDETKDSIVNSLGISKEDCGVRYDKVVVEDPDDLELCYRTLKDLQKEVERRFGKETEVIANYTGGTKTMSVALAVAALLNARWQLSLNKGPRVDLVKVRGGDLPVLTDKTEFSLEFCLAQVRNFLGRYEYDAAEELLAQVTRHQYLSRDQEQRVLRWRRLCQAFFAWDIFDHKRALTLLRSSPSRAVEPFINALLDITGASRGATGYEKVVDLLYNAGRRALQSRYDDAVARLYRAVELLAQTRLKQKWEIETGKVELEKIPEGVREFYRNLQGGEEKLQLGLRNAYRLLADLGDEVGKIWQEREKTLLSALEKRNYSILAHGTEPVGEEDYRKWSQVYEDFINNALSFLGIRTRCLQLPREELLEM